MKVLVVIFLLISTKSAFGTHGRLSRGMLPSPQRRHFPLSHPQRERSNVARSIYLRQLFLDRLMSVYYQNCPNEEKLPSIQKLPSVPKLQTPGFRNDMFHPTMRNSITTNGLGKRYFINPNILILSPIMKIVQPTRNNFQKKTINKQNPPQYLRRVSKNKEIAKAVDTKKKESFRTENLKDFQPNAAKAIQNISKFEENQTISAEAKVLDGFSHPNTVKLGTVTYPTPNSFSLVRPNRTQTYEVEEILEDTINVEDDFYEMNKNNEAYFENELQTTSNEKRVVENTQKSTTTEVMEINSQPIENTSTSVSGDTERTKTPFVQTSASGQVQNTKVLQSGKNVLISGTETPSNLKTLQADSSRGSIQHSDRFPFRKFGKEQGVRQPANKIYASSNPTASVSTSGFTYGETKKPTTETNPFETATRSFFGFFTKKPFLSKWGKPAAKPKNLDLDSLNLVKNDSGPELTTGSTTEATFTTSTPVEDVTLNPFICAESSPATFPGDQITVEINTAISNVPKVRQSPRMSSLNMDLYNPNITKPNLEKFLDESLLIDLLPPTIKPDLKRDQESHEKYSRKLHFDRVAQEIAFNGINDKPNQEPRRSDILITEDLIENKNNENRISTVNYLDRLKAKDATSTDGSPSNAKMESYIPFMLEILNDIRENKISPENLSLLSSIFWKYWPKILELANNTKLDVLPLATMKSEKDFVAFLENLSSRSETITTEAQTDDNNAFQETDDYDYKDFYDYE